MALKVTLNVEKYANGVVGAGVDIESEDGRYLAGGQWHAETGALDIDYYAEDGQNVVNPETGDATNTKVTRNVWTLRGLLDAIGNVVSEN